jgi:hypothetical protein
VTHASVVRVVLGFAALLAGCSAVLGLDAPTLATCFDACADAGFDSAPPTFTDGSVDATRDAADAADSAPVCLGDDASAANGGVACGGGCYGLRYCSNSSAPVCCQQTSDAGATSYACTASEATCPDYPIVCANDDDCTGSDICCYFTSKITCDTTARCQSDGLGIICRPSVPDDCPTGKACNVPVVTNGVTSPYLMCEP